jgi:Protein of unknown function (DUF1217)
MLSTFADYKIITSSLQRSLDRKAAESSSKADIKYFQDHIGDIKTVDEFLGNQRLYTFAMKAYGLDDLIPAKGFMKKVLLAEPDVNGRVLTDRLQDPRYRAFALAFNFRSLGTEPGKIAKSGDPDMQYMIDTGYLARQTQAQKRFDYDKATGDQVQYFYTMLPYVKTIKDITSDYKLYSFVRTAVGLPDAAYSDDEAAKAAALDGKFDIATIQNANDASAFVDRYFTGRLAGRKAIVDPYFRRPGTFAGSDADVAQRSAYFAAKINAVKSATDIASDPVLADIARTALGLPATSAAKSIDEQAQEIGKKLDVTTLRDPRKLGQFLDKFKSAATDFRSATVKAYVQQTLETDAGEENQGVRLALYFRRKAPTVKSAYDFLADPALAQVIRTALGLPAEAAKSNVDSQARLIERKINLSDLKDPAKLEQLIKRFTIRWDAKNDTAAAPATAVLSGGSSGLNSDVLLRLQNIRLGAF